MNLLKSKFLPFQKYLRLARFRSKIRLKKIYLQCKHTAKVRNLQTHLPFSVEQPSIDFVAGTWKINIKNQPIII